MSLRVALDTNCLTDLLKGDPALRESVEWRDQVWIPLIVIGEIEAGFVGGDRLHRNRRWLQGILAKPTFGVLLPDRATAHQYALLFAQLKRSGTPVPDNALWISALAIQHDLALITRDRHFHAIPQLQLI